MISMHECFVKGFETQQLQARPRAIKTAKQIKKAAALTAATLSDS